MTGRRPILHSPQNPRAREHSPARRRKAGLALAEGERLAAEALAGNWPCERLYLNTVWLERDPSPVRPLLLLAAQRRCLIERVAPKVMEKLSACDTAPPAAVLCRPPEGIDRLPEPLPRRLLVLDGVQDPGNAGTMLRAADAFGFATVLTGDSVRPLNEKFIRASAGSCFHAGALYSQPGHEEVRGALRGTETRIYRLDPHEGTSPGKLTPPSGRIVLVAGNEARGPDQDAWPDAIPVRIDMRAGVESLNVAMSVAIALHHFRGAGA